MYNNYEASNLSNFADFDKIKTLKSACIDGQSTRPVMFLPCLL